MTSEVMKAKLALALLLTSLFSTSAMAAGPWSLDRCVEYALENNLNVRSAAIDNLNAELAVTEAKDAFLPTLSAGASQSWDFGRSLTSQNTYANRNNSGFSWNVRLSLPLFQGLQALRGLERARAARAASMLQTDAVRDEVTLAVLSYYLQALYNRELLGVSRQQLSLSATQLARQEAMLEAGKVPEVDVIQARSQVAMAEVDTVNAANNLRLALVSLAQLLELESAEGFDILPLEDTDPLALALVPESEVMARALGNYSAIRAAEANVATAESGVSLAKTGYLPRLSFGAGLSDNYYRMSGIENPSFSRQMRDNFAKSIGFTLSIPVFDAFATRNSVRRARTTLLSAQLDLQRRRSDLRKAVSEAWTQAMGARDKYAATCTAATASKAALDAMTEKYTYGKANATEWEQTRTNYISALSSQVQAKYEAILRTRIVQFYAASR